MADKPLIGPYCQWCGDARLRVPSWHLKPKPANARHTGMGSSFHSLDRSLDNVLAVSANCIYILAMKFTWSERKRSLSLNQHGLDFVDAPSVFAGLTFTFEDDRFSYQEQRFITLGLLAGIPDSVVHTETTHEIGIISFRKATQREARIYFSQVQD